ncbi:NADPH-dependent diflavin oxidoreductase 1 [Coemansia sp. RSA 353]|nr:NADPH-dependent diflavin oxidoreductase 1 [Coemansia sp. RSA 788]KAJ2264728.1 NADPH-dependent diflavin oxidoreductase 1 [Coemansia sp. RSA 371]KAJ2295989.1 NADPH-dependent diflavin oxidoreductase 1 [Coemansia sp. RSA 353]
MKLPAGPTPIIMVGPGTGIAAFMAFIDDRVSRNISANYLFFGCRNEHGDFLHQEQLQKWVSCDKLQLFCAFSRDQENTIYVQQRVREQGDLLWSLISEQDAIVYVSGNANRMPDDVRQAFTDVIADHGVDDAAAYVQAMVKTGRYQEECWY